MAKAIELAAEMKRANTGFHAKAFRPFSKPHVCSRWTAPRPVVSQGGDARQRRLLERKHKQRNLISLNTTFPAGEHKKAPLHENEQRYD
jgi:hypothetical protein